EYIAEAEDVNGKISSISFIVHPRENIQPQVRLVAPKEGQYIVAGAIQLQAVVAFADDGEIKPESDITLFVDGVRVSTKWRVYSESGANSAFDEIYDELESLYDQKTATEYGRADSKNSGVYYGSFSMPEGIVRVSEPLEIKAVIQDKKGALSSHVVTVIAAPDEVKPEVLIWQPDFAYAPIENTDFTLSLSAYDNVKVSRIEVYQGYGISLPDGQYIDGDWPNLLLTINNIPAVDAVPVSVENIDTPVYEKTLHVPSIPEILANLSPDLMGKFNENYRIDYRVRIRVVDSNGNENISYSSFPVRIDERPVIDFVEPLPGASVVEGDRLYVNVHGFDDVGLAYVRLTAYHGNETEADKISELKISGGPYNYLVDVPAYIPDSENNQLILIAEAVDTYGDRIGDLDNHRVSERLSLFIVEDEKPVVTIASPANNAIFTEGQTILVEVNATDDIGIRQSSITVDGMINGNKSLVDSDYPYEFAVKIPYGQAGTPLVLNAQAVEQVYGGKTARSVSSANAVTLSVQQDTQPPSITLRQPQPGDTTFIVEDRDLSFDAVVIDNVEVASVRVDFIVNGKSVASALSTSAPFFGRVPVKTIAHYLGSQENLPEELAATFRITATDGAGNQSDFETPLIIKRNLPPEITNMGVLDQRGYAISTEDGLTMGRDVTITVIASDEFGVDAAELYRLNTDGSYTLVGSDYAAPFQYPFQIRQDVGTELKFRAKAKDYEGNWLDLGGNLSFIVTENKAPQVSLVDPINGNSAVIEGQTLRVVAEVNDDLGSDGVQRVDFFVNDILVDSIYQNMTQAEGYNAAENKYAAYIILPEGISGAVLQAVAYDRLGLEGKS